MHLGDEKMNVIYATDYGDDFLMHYGRKGMKWGQHIFGTEGTSTQRDRLRYFNRTSAKKAKLEGKIDKYETYATRDAQAGYTASARRWQSKHRKASEKLLNMNDQDIAQEKHNRRVDINKQSRIAGKLKKAEERGNAKKVAKLQSKKQDIEKDLSATEQRLKLVTEKGKTLVSINKMKGYKVIERPQYKRYLDRGLNAVDSMSDILVGYMIGGVTGALVMYSGPYPYEYGTKYKLK